MSERENNEIDSLLRGLARRDRLSASAANGELSAETANHLDADEMSAYAERALPEAARARYTAHLADCGDCRQLVTQLSVAVGLPAPEGNKETAASSWKEKFAALLSPSAWRYAMPALVLLVVVAVGFFALRQNRDTAFVAQNQKSERVAGSANKEPSAAAPASGGTETASNPEHAASQKHSPTPATSSRTDAAGATAEANATPAVALADDKDSGKARGEAGGGQPATAAAPPAPPAADKTTTAPAPARSADEISTEEAGADKKKEAERKKAAGVTRGNVQGPRKVTAADEPQTGRSRERQAETRDARGGAQQESETRAVAGHRFTRKNGMWVDAAFASSRSPVVVTRGSEQYRALIADEPGIRAIAEQLSGVVIVVWNGHAYRIQ